MDSEYDCKFEEMKKYIPFLENMISRLESTSTPSTNPRQAQLDKIRSLRDLLSNKKKRMKMENLLKCEQVLVNLYAKVEQRDKKTSDFSIDTPTPKEKSDLEAVRNKLKSVVKRQENPQDTLPEILPRSEINDVHTSGTKEPALFQRRPNQQSNLSSKEKEDAIIISPGSTSKRSYTRVLVSPEPNTRRWSPSHTTTDKPLFSRRSPRKSPRRHSPSYYIKEKKKTKDKSRKQNDLNITLNVPEESLNSLNTKDILSRIINCSDGDVDIDTLRVLRKQILGELQKTGAKDDISDLILKSYNKTKNIVGNKSSKVEEVEEGELSDSESEAIESIYGSLVVKEPGQTKTTSDKGNQPRKIQICLVINSDNKSEVQANELPKQETSDLTELEMYEKDDKVEIKTVANKDNNDQIKTQESKESNENKYIMSSKNDDNTSVGPKSSTDKIVTSLIDDPTDPIKEDVCKPADDAVSTIRPVETISKDCDDAMNESILYKANFYKPLVESSNVKLTDNNQSQESASTDVATEAMIESIHISKIENALQKMEMPSEIPLLHERTIEKKPPDNALSEIDILQALKNEILSEITVPGTENSTPLLHQPKVIKVANAQTIQQLPKKRISIEKYKEKSVASSQSPLQGSHKEEQSKKPSLKLTDKECERFFNVPKISFDEDDESLDEDDDDGIQASDVYGDLAPKSPEDEDSSNIGSTPPVIIPVDPIKNESNYNTDVDMRALPILSPNSVKTTNEDKYITTSINHDFSTNKCKTDCKIDNHSLNRPILVDPRVRREDLNLNTSTQSPNPHANDPDRTPRQNSIMTPNARTYEMTPTHQSFEMGQSTRKHVYLPTMSDWDKEMSMPKDTRSRDITNFEDRRSRIGEVRESTWNSHKDLSSNDNYGKSSKNRYVPDLSSQSYGRKETSMPSFGRSDCPSTPNHPFGRIECPPTPSHPFGRVECPPTPNHSFGRLDCPPTPSHPFGRIECPPTPSHSFGRMECPTTPSHPFGRMDCPVTPSHHFGRSDCPSTPSHSFGRSEAPTPLMSIGATPNNTYIGPDCPVTPTPSFGRSDCTPLSNHAYAKSECVPMPNKPYGLVSQTPSHPYGRTETLKSQYNRPDFNKDPRLNRKFEPEIKSRYDERDRAYYKEHDRYRASSGSSQKSYSGSNNYGHYDRDPSNSRNSRYKYFAPDLSARQFGKEQERRDRPVENSITNDWDSSRGYNRDRWYGTESRTHEEIGSRRECHERKSMRSEETQYGVMSGLSNNRSKDRERNKLSVESNTGRSFTIDTSVNATFQKIIDSAKEMQEIPNSIDERRQRATSVGRSLARESSVGRASISNLNENKREAFQRASSVGREVLDSNKDIRSFQEIKADFKSYRNTDNKLCEITKQNTRKTELNSSDKKDKYEKQRNEQSVDTAKSYSARMNYRDPRMRKLMNNKIDTKGANDHNRRSGIVYSNDNIVKGSILTSGYGVKNYKIPKIKRAMEEKEDSTSKCDDTEKHVKNDSDSEKSYVKEIKGKAKVKGVAKDLSKKVKEAIDTAICTGKRQTRSNKKSMEEPNTNMTGKLKKGRTIIYDSDSNDSLESLNDMKVNARKEKNEVTDTLNQEIKGTDITINKDIEPKGDAVEQENQDAGFQKNESKDISSISGDINMISEDVTAKSNLNSKTTLAVQSSPLKERKKKNLNSANLSSNFEIEELEMFSDNIVSDPVIDNINALIADLDNDLGTSRSDLDHNFTKEITLENMMQNISSPLKDSIIESDEDSAKLLQDIDTISGEKVKLSDCKVKGTSLIDTVISPNLEIKMSSNNSATKENLLDSDKDPTKLLKDIDKISNDNVEVPNNSQKRSESLNDSLVHPNLQLKMSSNNSTLTKYEDECNLKETLGNIPTQSDALLDSKSASTPTSVAMSINYDIDSTTEVEKNEKPIEDRSELNNQKFDGDSTPDSAVNRNDTLLKSSNDESLPCCINEVTSTELLEVKSCSAKEMPPALDSIGSLLSILQDKSKIKELLHMLGDHSSENEKIKKKLEKLREIVSDDDELPDVSDNKNIDKVNITDEKEIESMDQESLSMNSSPRFENNTKIGDNNETSDIEELQQTHEQNVETKPKKKQIKKNKYMKRSKGKAKKGAVAVKRITRATVAEYKPKVKKPPRELMQLQEDIKEMFIRDDVLSATGIRMCRLAKLVDEKPSQAKEEQTLSEPEPVVVLEKFKETDKDKFKSKKLGSKMKVKNLADSVPMSITQDKTLTSLKNKPGPKSKTKNKEVDPYAFDLDSFAIDKANEAGSSSNSGSESDSLVSCKSFDSTELLADIKKKTKRKRRGWQVGVIKTKTKKKKEQKQDLARDNAIEDILPEKVAIPDINCFTDRNYCFQKNLFIYSCRLCTFTGTDIVLHYRNQHPHFEIPLSRITPEVAKEVIEQCEEIDFRAVSKIPSDKYICTFCYKEFAYSKTVLETFFWHVVSMHTGEYKHNCSQCDNENACPFNLDIPPPPKDTKGQLIGFICKKCNFTQISLENLKTHVIKRHNDEQTAVYIINLSVMTKKTLNALVRRTEHYPAQLPVTVTDDEISMTCLESNEGVKTRTSTKKATIVPPIQSKITFEGDDNNSELSDMVSDLGEGSIKTEKADSENADAISNNEESFATDVSENDRPSDSEDQLPNHVQDYPVPQPTTDIMNYPHFKVNITESGAKEYLCCINGNNHFKTTLLISMKKHVQFKHSEPWEGYCFVCKVIVTPLGTHRFIDCLQHYLDNHMDNFPIMEKVSVQPPVVSDVSEPLVDNPASKPYINVRPLSELITRTVDPVVQESANLPVIQSVMSLGTSVVESPRSSPAPIYPAVVQEKQVEIKIFKYEEHQADVISKKYYLVLQGMMTTENLVKIFKCSGRYCSYVTDSTEEALVHATTHQRLGGIDSLNCSYCDFDSAGNALDLVMHVFKSHGSCTYCCQQCFYRAASSQAVGAHWSRAHGNGVLPGPGNVIRTTATSTIPAAKVNMLTRENAVSFYVCGHGKLGDSCKFQSYTPDKFCEHLLQRHATASVHPCQLCSADFPTASDLVQHMKTHGLKLYQCTWCIHGADNENEMLAHVSSVHPDKQPQAYIRIITNKEPGGKALRVLPLAFLTKYKVPTQDFTPSATKDHPVREAERSIEMEALIGPFIGDTSEKTAESVTEPETPIQSSEIPEELIEPQDTKPPVNILIPEPTIAAPQIVQPTNITSTDRVPPLTIISPAVTPSIIHHSATAPIIPSSVISPIISPSGIPPIIPTSETLPRIPPSATPPINSPLVPPSTVPPLNPSATTISVKKEPVEKESIPADIVVLDSDEEDVPTTQSTSVIQVSDDEVSSRSKKVPIESLYTCPKCRQICKTVSGFKRHLTCCITDRSRVQCAHCPYVAETLFNVTWHYLGAHTEKSTFECGLCKALLETEHFAKNHMKSAHKETNLVFTRCEKGDTARYIVTVKKTTKERTLPKRKLSGPKNDAIPAKRRFEPQEIDQLPINPILDHLVYCSKCEFSTKVRLNMVRHLQLHAEQQPVPQTAPVNPVPHLESNEKHFDKMVNLASSSVVNRTPDKPRQEPSPSVSLLIPPEAAARYPKYVPERHRHTCGAKGCSYISVDEAMLRRHWDALHSGTNDFHCVHCPPHQHLDTSKPLTATRIVSHLKMHDATLYACSACSYYHFKREALEKHLSEIHKTGRLMVVREETSAPVSPSPAQSSSAPTMDLKPWQCGLCKFKSLLRPEVVEHCSKLHQSKMQFKCGYCPFRTSAIENINKHQNNSHAGKPEEVFYYYYREGSIPDASDGTPRWMKQRQKAGPSEPEVKVESQVSPTISAAPTVTTPLTIDLNLVKKEVNETASGGLASDMQDLCKLFGQFCEPNGIKFKCPLCSIVMEETRDLMQSHLYEELNYRKWSCGSCAYKAFHKAGLRDHMVSEHRRQYDHVELPKNVNIERWVTAVLDHQVAIIEKRRENLQSQKIVEPNKPDSSMDTVAPKETARTYSDKDLETAFGSFGLPNCIMFCCPKCGFLSKEEALMRDHLEMELNKIRWCCTTCPENFQTYHEAQFHCKSHGSPSRPTEALRDPIMRSTWISATIQKQKKLIQNLPMTSSALPSTPEKSVPENENSLLVVRYEERVDTPDQVRTKRRKID